jgi:predicted nicotinamide N-methyase
MWVGWGVVRGYAWVARGRWSKSYVIVLCPRSASLPNGARPRRQWPTRRGCTTAAMRRAALLLACLPAVQCLCACPITLSKHRTVHIYQEDDGGYASRLWGCSVGMSRWLVEDEADLSGVRALEIGAGTGLVSLALAARGAQVTATDISAEALRLIEMAAEEQSLPVTTARFDVCGNTPLPPSYDLVVASDTLYTPPLAEAMARRCVEALAAGCYVVMGDPGRPEGRELFFEALEEQNRVLPRIRGSWAAGGRDWLQGIGGCSDDNGGGRRPESERLLLLHFESSSDPFRCETHSQEPGFEEL